MTLLSPVLLWEGRMRGLGLSRKPQWVELCSLGQLSLTVSFPLLASSFPHMKIPVLGENSSSWGPLSQWSESPGGHKHLFGMS